MARGLEPRVIAALEAVYKDKWRQIVDEQAIQGTNYPAGETIGSPVHPQHDLVPLESSFRQSVG